MDCLPAGDESRVVPDDLDSARKVVIQTTEEKTVA